LAEYDRKREEWKQKKDGTQEEAPDEDTAEEAE